MKNILHIILFFIICSACFANSPPTVKNVTASQRTDSSGIVDIEYTLSDADNDRCDITLQVSDDGSSWGIKPSSSALSGDLNNVYPGRRHIEWNSKADLPGAYGSNYRIKITADDGSGPGGMVWVYIDDDGSGMKDENGSPIDKGGFTGYMSKYETTNAQYCQYLNQALDSGDIVISGGEVDGNGGPYDGEIYYDMDDSDAQISWNGSEFYVETRDGYDMSNHPVVEVSWYGATAFANYYGWRLPTEWEWQAVADHHSELTYGCGPGINHNRANYDQDNPLNLSDFPYTAPVNYYETGGRPGPYGYGMCDMAGNVWEWTDSWYSGSHDDRVLRGGAWGSYMDGSCRVSHRYYNYPRNTDKNYGFRICR